MGVAQSRQAIVYAAQFTFDQWTIRPQRRCGKGQRQHRSGVAQRFACLIHPATRRASRQQRKSMAGAERNRCMRTQQPTQRRRFGGGIEAYMPMVHVHFLAVTAVRRRSKSSRAGQSPTQPFTNP
jgi:hypothetical protein